MSDEKRRILEMLADGTITQEDAERLLDALGETGEEEPREPAEAIDGNQTEHREQKGEELDAEISEKPGGEEFLAATEKLGGIGQMIRNAVNRAVKKIPELTLHPEMEIPDLPDIPDIPDVPAIPMEPVTSTTDLVPTDTRSVERCVVGIRNVYVNWPSGGVFVHAYDGSDILMIETANKPLEDFQRLAFTVNDDELTIHWCLNAQKANFKNWGLTKNLEVLLPREIAENLDEVAVTSGSGAVNAEGLHGEDLSFTSGSGAVAVSAVDAEDLTARSGSGAVSLRAVRGEDINAVSGSGAVVAENVRGEDISIKSGSGCVTVNTVHGEDITVQSGSGRVDARTVHGEDVNINSGSGSVYAFDIRSEDDANIHSASGRVEVEMLHSEECANIHAVSGSVKASGLEVQEGLNLHTVSGSVKADLLRMPESIRVKTVSGSAQLTMPDTPEGFNLKYSGGNAYPNSDFHLTGELKKNGGTVTYGAGETDIAYITVTGSLTLKKSETV